MKISVITLQNVSNYGSVLQAYATQVFFQSLGYQVEMVDYWRRNMIDQNIAQDLVEHKNLKLKKYWGKSNILKLLAKDFLYLKIKNNAKPFRDFVKKNIVITRISYTSYEQLKENPPIADIYCVGSDQVWNSGWNGNFDLSFYLCYAPEGKRKIAFSSSFGVETISQDEGQKIKNSLRDFSFISVREKSAITLLNDIGISNVYWFLDPTLLIDKKQWETLVKKNFIKKEKYILVYQLNENSFFDQAVEETSKMTSTKIIRLEYKQSKKNGEHIVRPSISEWITYFYYADYVITDSFHATAFSINFEKQFVNILPSKYGTRITSVLELCGLLNRKINRIEDIVTLVSSIDYNSVNRIIDKCRADCKSIIASEINKAL